MRPWIAIFIALPFFCAAHAVADALLLRNGNTMEGSIQRSRGAYVVRKANGGSIHIPRSKVQLHAKTLDEIFRWKLRRVGPNDIKGQVQLANWCVREGLTHNAVDRLLHLSQIAPSEPAVKSLERQMRSRVKGKSKVVHAIAKIPIESSASKNSGSAPLVELKEDSVLEFRRAVQPLLINRCGQAACHGSNSPTDFSLTHYRNQRPNRQMTLNNLESTIRLLSHVDPPESVLLTKASQIHGNQNHLAFEARDIRQFRRLETWVFRLLDYDAQQVAASQNDSQNGAVATNSGSSLNRAIQNQGTPQVGQPLNANRSAMPGSSQIAPPAFQGAGNFQPTGGAGVPVDQRNRGQSNSENGSKTGRPQQFSPEPTQALNRAADGNRVGTERTNGELASSGNLRSAVSGSNSGQSTDSKDRRSQNPQAHKPAESMVPGQPGNGTTQRSSDPFDPQSFNDRFSSTGGG